MFSLSEENYIKAIYSLASEKEGPVSTNAIAEVMKTKAASVTDMIKKLSAKKVLEYKKYKGVQLSDKGEEIALHVIRKHRLWETFLVNKLRFNWDEVHEVAEQLEHIRSPLLIERLDEFLEFPKFDPHGDPIPDADGKLNEKPRTLLRDANGKQPLRIVAVNDVSASFLQYLDKIGVYLGASIKIQDRIDFDGSLEVILDRDKQLFISKEVSENIWVTD